METPEIESMNVIETEIATETRIDSKDEEITVIIENMTKGEEEMEDTETVMVDIETGIITETEMATEIEIGTKVTKRPSEKMERSAN